MTASARRMQAGWMLLLSALAPLAAGAAAPLASGALELPQRPVWVGEVFELQLRWRIEPGVYRIRKGPLQWQAAPLIAEPWSVPEFHDAGTLPAASDDEIRMSTRAMAIEAGNLSLQPAHQTMTLKTGIVASGGYERAEFGDVEVVTPTAKVEVWPLPPAPAGFSNAVGRFRLSASVQPGDRAVGRPITWTLRLSGTGNWPYLDGLPARPLPRDVELVGQPRQQQRSSNGIFDAELSEDVVLMPKREGVLTFGAVSMTVFDPELEDYVELKTDPITLEIGPGSLAPGADPPSTETVRAPEYEPVTLSARPIVAPNRLAPRPMPTGLWRLLCIAPFVGLACMWLFLFVMRQWELDPNRVLRAADRRLERTLGQLLGAHDDSVRRRLVRAWQRDFAIRCRLQSAAPTAAHFDGIEAPALWREAELFLYGRRHPLPSDWLSRARQARAALEPVPAFSPALPGRPSLLLCLRRMTLCMCPALLCVQEAPFAAPSPEGGTAAVKTAGPERTLQQSPLNWGARYNLALELAGEQRWSEAAGHAAIAWVQQPNNLRTRALWQMASIKAGYVTGRAGGVPRADSIGGRVAGLASPAIWRWLAVFAATAVAAAAALLLLMKYGYTGRVSRCLGTSIVGSALLLGATAAFALDTWGTLAKRNAVLLWQATSLRHLPVHTPAEDEPIVVAAGTVGFIDREFLNWSRVVLADGRAGWVCDEWLLRVWGQPTTVRME